MPFSLGIGSNFTGQIVSQIILHINNSPFFQMFNAILNPLRMAHNEVVVQIYGQKDISILILFPDRQMSTSPPLMPFFAGFQQHSYA